MSDVSSPAAPARENFVSSALLRSLVGRTVVLRDGRQAILELIECDYPTRRLQLGVRIFGTGLFWILPEELALRP